MAPRLASRALLLDDHQNIFLLHIQADDHSPIYWITPGGGLEPHEDFVSALQRELLEELSLHISPDQISAPIWTRAHTFQWLGREYIQHEHFFVVRYPGVCPPLHLRWANAEEQATLRSGRWWSLQNIHDSPHLLFAPRKLAHWLARLLREPLPTSPIDISDPAG